MTTERRTHNLLAATLPVIAVVLAGWALRATYVVTMPLAFAFFLAVLVYPVQRRVAGRVSSDRWRWLGTAAAMGVVVAGLLVMWG